MDSYTPILIVDDHQAMRRTIANLMRKQGFSNLFYAENGQMAWDLLQRQRFGLVLLDWNMPKMSGIEVLRKVRESEDLTGMPILMVTAEAEKNQVLEAHYCGVTDYIVKPFTPLVLETKVKALLEMAEKTHWVTHSRP
jgi:two-component system, chemotaxis family, chemotaxis protein CheY